MKIPEIRISFSELIYGNESRALADNFDFKLESKEFYYDKTFQYWQEWSKNEKAVITELQKVLGVHFYLPVIDVVCAPFFIPKSHPLILNFSETPKRFVDVLTHELCHVLLTDNNKYQQYNEAPAHFLTEDWERLFGKHHHPETLLHIPVHALCKYIFTDVLESPERVKDDIQACKKWVGGEPYIKSWEYVNRHDYHEIIKKLKSVYNGD